MANKNVCNNNLSTAHYSKLADQNATEMINTNTKPPLLKGLGVTLFEKMKEHKGKIAQTNAITGETETYDVVFRKTVRTALAMRSKGIQPSDIITICSNNSLDSFIPYYAAAFLGAVSANLDPKLPPNNAVHLIGQVRPKMIFVSLAGLKLIEDALHHTSLVATIVVFGETSKYLKYEEFLRPSPQEDSFTPFVTNNLKDTAVVVFTSGSTGLPKGACLTHLSLVLKMSNSGPDVPPLSVTLTHANLFWIAAVIIGPRCIANGMNNVIVPEFDRDMVWRHIDKYKVSEMQLNTYYAIEMCRYGRPADVNTSSLTTFVVAGAPVTREQIKHIKECLTGTLVVNNYGQTELCSNVFVFNFNNPIDRMLMEEKPESIGKQISSFTYKIVHPDTEKPVGPYEEGELRIKAETIMNGYYNMDSKDSFDSDGYFKTGDIVYYDDDQCFFFVDRIKELLKYRMWHISPAKLEAIIDSHPAVSSSAVIGVPHPVDWDHLMAVVVLNELFLGEVSEPELVKFVNDKVGEHEKIRAGIVFVENLPRTVNGKINRAELKKLYINAKH